MHRSSAAPRVTASSRVAAGSQISPATPPAGSLPSFSLPSLLPPGTPLRRASGDDELSAGGAAAAGGLAAASRPVGGLLAAAAVLLRPVESPSRGDFRGVTLPVRDAPAPRGDGGRAPLGDAAPEGDEEQRALVGLAEAGLAEFLPVRARRHTARSSASGGPRMSRGAMHLRASAFISMQGCTRSTQVPYLASAATHRQLAAMSGRPLITAAPPSACCQVWWVLSACCHVWRLTWAPA